MEYRQLGRTGLKVSELCLGAMNFGWTTSEADSRAALDPFVAAGGNFVDTADVYAGGKSEEILGNWLSTQPRDQIIVATKVRFGAGAGPNGVGLSRHHILHQVEVSLRRLQTDYIDLYQTHSPDSETPLDETLRALDDLVRDGKVRGVALENGDEILAPVVVSTLHPKTAFLQQMDAADLPSEFVRDIENYKTRSGVVKLNLALSELPSFTAAPGPTAPVHHTGPVAKSEHNAARIFNADHLFFVTNGPSTSNKIVWHSEVATDDIVLVDRNCHKSILHAIMMTGTVPIFLQPTRNHLGIIGPIPLAEFDMALSLIHI